MTNRLQGVRARVGLGFGVVVALLVAVAFTAWVQLRNVDGAQARQHELEQLRRDVVQWNANTRLNVARTITLARAGSPADLAKWLDGEMKQTSAAITQLQKGIESRLADPQGQARLGAVAKARQSYVDLRSTLLKRLADPAQLAAATADIDAKLMPAAQAYLGALDAVLAHVDAENAGQEKVQEASLRQAAIVLPSLSAAGIGLALLLAWGVGGAIARPLREAANFARRIAAGDLTQAVRVTSGGEIGELQSALVQMQDGLRTVVAGIRSGTESLNVASTEIASGNQDLSARTESAAASLEQTSASMKELARAIEQSASSAEAASALATQAVEVARRGRRVVADVAGTMTGIEADSKRIAEITGVIDGIAFQTNILALNAAVEAARAGEQGRGFAVVAGEVRALAARSAQAANEIKSLVQASTRQVREGAALAQSAGTTMDDIEHSVEKFSHAFSGIREAASGQANGVSEVTSAVSRLDEITQQNAALVEQSAAAAEGLNQQAGMLARAVASFRLQPALA